MMCGVGADNNIVASVEKKSLAAIVKIAKGGIKMLKILLFLFIISFALPVSGIDLKGKTISITDDGSEWAPYTYYKRVDNKVTNEIIGYSVDVIKEIFDKNGINYTIELLPWKRAQMEVETGNDYQMFLSGSYNEERSKKYYISLPYYSTSAYYFYSKHNYPNGISIKTKTDLKKYRLAGLLGHNYTNYGINPDEIYTGASTYKAVFTQINHNRYDLFLESLEIIAGYSAIEENILADPDLGYGRVPEMKSVDFYMMFTKNEVGKELKRVVDNEIRAMEKSGRMKELLRKYVPE